MQKIFYKTIKLVVDMDIYMDYTKVERCRNRYLLRRTDII